jgi:hypothetical protein
MAVDAIVFDELQNGVVIVIPVIPPTTVNSIVFADNYKDSGIVIDKKEGQKNVVFIS